MLSKKLIISKILTCVHVKSENILPLKHRNWKLVLAFYFKSLRTAAIFLSFLTEERNFIFCQKNWEKLQLIDQSDLWIVFAYFFFSAFAEAAPATLALHCIALKKVADCWLPKTIQDKCENLHSLICYLSLIYVYRLGPVVYFTDSV